MHHSHIYNYEVADAGLADRRMFAHDDAELFRKRTTKYVEDFRNLVLLARQHDKAAAAELYARFHFRFVPVAEYNTRTFA